MEHLIFIREAITDSEIARFFEKLHSYHRRDIFPKIEQAEDLAYFLSDEYLSQLKTLHRRQENRLHFLFFERGGQDIGFTMPVIYGSEDDKCFIMEFCVYPEFRGSSTGHACGEALLSWARERRASYFELNCDTAPRERFWGRLGFLPNGCDEWNIPLMLRPPEEDAPITVSSSPVRTTGSFGNSKTAISLRSVKRRSTRESKRSFCRPFKRNASPSLPPTAKHAWSECAA